MAGKLRSSFAVGHRIVRFRAKNSDVQAGSVDCTDAVKDDGKDF